MVPVCFLLRSATCKSGGCHHGEHVVPSPQGTPASRADQISIDISPAMFDQECTFWHTITGWSLNDSPLGEFRSLERPDGQPLRFLLQRLDENLSPNQPHAHLDLACAENIEAIGRRHRAIGASVLGPTKVWMRMQDPAGLDYCLTPRGFNPDR